MKGVFKCAKGDDERRFRSTKILSLGFPQHPQEIFKETQASNLGDAPVHPVLHQQSFVRPSPHYIFITSCIMCYAWSVLHLLFSFLVFLLIITRWTLTYIVWERSTLNSTLKHNIVFMLIF